MLTRDEVMALSGDELNLAVAEKVMGCKLVTTKHESRLDESYTAITEWVGPNGLRLPEFWSPSSDWSAMGALIERMTAQCWNVYIEGGYENEFQCGFSRVPDGEINDEDIVWFYAKGCTAAQAVSEIPAAVARAALLAVGEDMHRD